MKTHKEPITSFISGRFLLSGGKCCFPVKPIPLARAYICGDSSQLNTAANDTYQNNTCQELAEMEKLEAKSLISPCDVDKWRQGYLSSLYPKTIIHSNRFISFYIDTVHSGIKVVMERSELIYYKTGAWMWYTLTILRPVTKIRVIHAAAPHKESVNEAQPFFRFPFSSASNIDPRAPLFHE